MSVGDDDLPVHLPMSITATSAPNHDELTLIVGDCTGSMSTILKGKLLPACNHYHLQYERRNVLYLLFTISPVSVSPLLT